MEVVQDKVKLGWKTCDAPKREPANRLETDEDVRKAFKAFIPMLESNRRRKPVYMMIINLVYVARLLLDTTALLIRLIDTARGEESPASQGH